MDRPPLKEAANARPSRLLKPGTFLKPPSSSLPRPAEAKRKAISPSNSIIEEADPAPKKRRVGPPASAPVVRKPGVGASRPAISRPATVGARPTVARTSGGNTSLNRSTGRLAMTAARPAAGRPAAAAGVKPRAGAAAKPPPAKVRPEIQAKKLEAELSELREEHERLQPMVQDLQVDKEQLEWTLERTKRTLRETEEDYERQLKKERMSREELEDNERQMKRKVDRLEEELEEKRKSIADLRESVRVLEEQVTSCRGEITELTARTRELHDRIKDHQMTIDHLRSTLADREAKIVSLESTIADQAETIRNLEAKIREDEKVRKALHNAVLELKGNIRVFCRVRPLLGEELAGVPGDDPFPQHIGFSPDGKSLELEKLADVGMNETLLNHTKGKNKYCFSFDQVFTPSSSQAQVFEEISQLVQSALDGYQVAIFAYGQTGSGKTYTMEGAPDPTDQSRGMIPRAVEQIFATAETLVETGWKYELQVSFLEIYNEKIHDLLCNHKTDVKHELKMVSPNSPEVTVTNLTVVDVSTPDEVHVLLKRASENRAVAETKANERSSRSHSVFRLHLHGFNAHTQEKCTGCLNMIDLAGSERLKQSKSEGERLKETQNINSSLANLGNVIMAIANKDNHIPYRNSKLTHLLSNSLGGSSKVLMFLNISPKEESFAETLNSLRFATKVNNCHIGTAQKKSK